MPYKREYPNPDLYQMLAYCTALGLPRPGTTLCAVRLVYVDESYCKVCYYVAALLVPETEVRSLSAALDEVVGKAAGSFLGLSSTAELHGYDMFHGERDWARLKPRARIGVYDQALRAIAEHNVAIVVRGVMSQRLRERYGDRAWHPHAIDHLVASDRAL